MAKVIVPADVPEKIVEEIKATAKEIYELLHCSGLARIDFFLSNDGTLYFNEINTMPGFTNISMYPKLWRHEGIGYPKLIEHLIDDALAR
jgi:D-alanine-D-alanine ligase